MSNFYDDRNDTGNVQVDYTVLNNEENGGYEEKPKPLKKWTAFKIVLAVIYALVTIYCIWMFIDACAETGKGRELGIAITITILIGGIQSCRIRATNYSWNSGRNNFCKSV